MQPKQTPLQRALSRKFLVTIAALIAIYHQAATLDLWSKLMIAAIAAVYVCGETVLDRAGQSHLLEVVRAALGPASGVPASASNLLANAIANEGLTAEAKGILSQAKNVIDSVSGSHPPVTISSAVAPPPIKS